MILSGVVWFDMISSELKTSEWDTLYLDRLIILKINNKRRTSNI